MSAGRSGCLACQPLTWAPCCCCCEILRIGRTARGHRRCSRDKVEEGSNWDGQKALFPIFGLWDGGNGGRSIRFVRFRNIARTQSDNCYPNSNVEGAQVAGADMLITRRLARDFIETRPRALSSDREALIRATVWSRATRFCSLLKRRWANALIGRKLSLVFAVSRAYRALKFLLNRSNSDWLNR